MIDIVLDHADFVVAHKPAGMAVHAHEGDTLLAAVRRHFDNDDIHPVHRLDLGTSGLVILAKTAAANKAFCQMFAEGQVQKMYLALSDGPAKKKQGWVKGDMAKARGGSYKLLRSMLNPAVTYGMSFGEAGQPRLWWLRPKTGKTHQLRVALKALGASIMGDARYGGSQANRLYLHAWGLRFSYAGECYDIHTWPNTGEYFEDSIKNKRIGPHQNPWDLVWPKSFDAATGPAGVQPR